MSVLPALTKNWQFALNRRIFSKSTSLEQNQVFMFAIKTILVGFAQNAWTVVASSDGSSNVGAADHWTTSDDLIWNNAGSNHSWIQLAQTGIADNFELVIDLRELASNNRIDVVASFSGFSGGSLTNRPTASDEFFVAEFAPWGIALSSPNTGGIMHVQMSEDGANTRIFYTRAGVVQALWLFEVPDFPPSGWSYPFVGYVNALNNVNVASVTQLSDVGALNGVSNDGDSVVASIVKPTIRNADIVSTNFTPSVFDNTFPMFPAEIETNSAGSNSFLGKLPDLYWVPFVNGAPGRGAMLGNTVPVERSLKRFCTMGQFLIPWDDTTTALTIS